MYTGDYRWRCYMAKMCKLDRRQFVSMQIV